MLTHCAGRGGDALCGADEHPQRRQLHRQLSGLPTHKGARCHRRGLHSPCAPGAGALSPISSQRSAFQGFAKYKSTATEALGVTGEDFTHLAPLVLVRVDQLQPTISRLHRASVFPQLTVTLPSARNTRVLSDVRRQWPDVAAGSRCHVRAVATGSKPECRIVLTRRCTAPRCAPCRRCCRWFF